MGMKKKNLYWKRRNRDIEGGGDTKKPEKPKGERRKMWQKWETAWKELHWGMGELIVKYEIVLQKGRYWVKMC